MLNNPFQSREKPANAAGVGMGNGQPVAEKGRAGALSGGWPNMVGFDFGKRIDPNTPEFAQDQEALRSLMTPEQINQGYSLGAGLKLSNIRSELRDQGYTFTSSALANHAVPASFTDGSTRTVFFPDEAAATKFFGSLGGQSQNIGSQLLSQPTLEAQYSNNKPVKI